MTRLKFGIALQNNTPGDQLGGKVAKALALLRIHEPTVRRSRVDPVRSTVLRSRRRARKIVVS